jgi:hypothetical protein
MKLGHELLPGGRVSGLTGVSESRWILKKASRIRITKTAKRNLRGEIPNFLLRFDFILGRIQLREQPLIFYSYKL